MTYEPIDAALRRWVAGNQLHLATRYRDEEVRSIEVVSGKGQRYQIWIDPPCDGNVLVHAWDYRKRREEVSVSVNDVQKALDHVLFAVQQWIQGEAP